MNACIVIVSLETLNAFKVSPIKESSDNVQIGDTKTYTQDGDNHYSWWNYNHCICDLACLELIQRESTAQ